MDNILRRLRSGNKGETCPSQGSLCPEGGNTFAGEQNRLSTLGVNDKRAGFLVKNDILLREGGFENAVQHQVFGRTFVKDTPGVEQPYFVGNLQGQVQLVSG